MISNETFANYRAIAALNKRLGGLASVPRGLLYNIAVHIYIIYCIIYTVTEYILDFLIHKYFSWLDFEALLQKDA